MRTIDANLILRYLTNDVPEQANRVGELLKRVEAELEKVFLPDVMLADTIWVLEGYYKQSRAQIRDWVTIILSLPGLEFSNKNVALNALDIYFDKGVDWSDAFAASQMWDMGITEIYSFDKHFACVEGITKVDP